MLKSMNVSFVSDAPILLHNSRLANPMDEFAKQLKEVSGVKKKTDEHHAKMQKIEWFGSLYLNHENKIIIPSEMIEACLTEGAKKSKLGKAFKSSVFVHDAPVLQFEDMNENINDLFTKGKYVDARIVKVGMNRIVRTRPIFMQWSIDFSIHYDQEVIKEAEIVAAATVAGVQVGIGDYRPKFGRFKAEFN